MFKKKKPSFTATKIEIDENLEPVLVDLKEGEYKKEISKQNTLDNANAFNEDEAKKLAEEDVRGEYLQGFQGWEYKFNTVASSRGDYPFIAISFGIGTSKWESMASECALEVRMKGQGKKGFKKPVLFPKLTFLYDENLHGVDKPLEWLFEKAIDCRYAQTELTEKEKEDIFGENAKKLLRI